MWLILCDSYPLLLLLLLLIQRSAHHPTALIYLFVCQLGLFITVFSKHGTRLDLLFGHIFSCDSMFEFVNSACSLSESVCVCVCVRDSVEPVEAGLTLRGRSSSTAPPVPNCFPVRVRHEPVQDSVVAPQFPHSVVAPGPRVTNSIIRSGVIIINTPWAFTARRWFIKNVDYILRRVTTFWSWTRPRGARLTGEHFYCVELCGFLLNKKAWMAAGRMLFIKQAVLQNKSIYCCHILLLNEN